MANREALRELQTRLASRLQAARDEATSLSSWLAAEAARSSYLLPLGQTGGEFLVGVGSMRGLYLKLVSRRCQSARRFGRRGRSGGPAGLGRAPHRAGFGR